MVEMKQLLWTNMIGVHGQSRATVSEACQVLFQWRPANRFANIYQVDKMEIKHNNGRKEMTGLSCKYADSSPKA